MIRWLWSSHLNTLVAERSDDDILRVVAEGAFRQTPGDHPDLSDNGDGLLPLAYGIGGRDAWMAPMALTLGYGILFATPLTLVLVPCLYVIRNDISKLFQRKRSNLARR